MIKATMLVPMRDNYGQQISPNEIGRCLHSIVELCGGYTRSEPLYTGVYKDVQGKMYFDTLFSLMVCCEPPKLPQLKLIAADIAKVCRQKCLYFEYHEVYLDFIEPGESNHV